MPLTNASAACSSAGSVVRLNPLQRGRWLPCCRRSKYSANPRSTMTREPRRPGLIGPRSARLPAAANRGLLYIDEVNLLDDHVVDLLLDSAAMGVNIVEREGISFIHPARFILIGTMNPEDGDLRPQLLDRFALAGG